MSEHEVIQKLNERTHRTVTELQEEWGTEKRLDPIDYGPIPWHRDGPPESVEEQLEEFAGMASVIVFRSEKRLETILVYSRSGYWEPPGGAIEDAKPPAEIAKMEAREEAGIEVELTDLAFTREVNYQYESGDTVTLPAVTFVGVEVSGSLRPERASSTHSYATHGVGVFGSDVLPEACRDREHILDLFEGLPPYDPMPPSLEDE